MNPREPDEVRARGEAALREGRYEDALTHFDWYWRYALAHEPSQAGVRLSFFLTEMQKLAEAYQPAAERLDEWRNEARLALLGDSADPSDLSDYFALAARTDADKELAETLERLHENESAVFVQNAAHHWQKLIEHGLVGLAQHYRPDVEREVRLLHDYVKHSQGRGVSEMKFVIASSARRIDRFFGNLEKLEIGGLIDGAIELIVDTFDASILETIVTSMKPGTYQRRQLAASLDN